MMDELPGVTLIARLDALLDHERRLLLEGALGEIEPVMEDKAQLIAELTESPPDSPNSIAPLQLKLRRNQELFDHALAGIRTVADRLGALRQVRRSMTVYDAQGRCETIDAEPANRLEHRA